MLRSRRLEPVVLKKQLWLVDVSGTYGASQPVACGVGIVIALPIADYLTDCL